MFKKTVVLLALVGLCIYLFVSAPVPLAEPNDEPASIAIADALAVLAAENTVVRTLWTREIVGKGGAVGLRFDEDWRERDVEAGPLPALFLRAVAGNLQQKAIGLGLFLGSDAPLRRANAFRGEQSRAFKRLRSSGAPQFFFAPDVERYTAMFADVAVAAACVDCHNEHPEAPRRDWQLGDIMGATTWTYPKQAVSPAELLGLIAAFRASAADAYARYLKKTQSFDRPPPIGNEWPASGYALPTAAVFMAEVERQASSATLAELLRLESASR